MSAPHVLTGRQFPIFSQRKTSIKSLSVAVRTVNVHQVSFVMKRCDLLMNESVDFMNGVKLLHGQRGRLCIK